jgi:hypothetical protein
MYTLTPATIDHAIQLHAYICDADREELRVTQSQPLEAICRGIFDSANPVSIWDKHGHIAAIAGVVPVDVSEAPGYGSPWMLSTDAAKTQPVAFVRQARQWVQEELKTWGILAHQVYRHNHDHIRLLRLLGFQVEEPKADHPLQLFLPFHQCALQ